MKNIFINIIITILLILPIYCCEYDPIVKFGEQYKKVVYIVNSQGLHYIGDVNYGEEKNFIDISVYCASSEPIKKDLDVTLKIDPKALDSLNKLNYLGNPLYIDKLILPENYYSISDYTVTIKAGTQYSVFRLPVDPKGIDADKTYALPVSIVSNSQNFDINPEMSSIVYELNMINNYSGNYSGISTEYPDKTRTVQLTLKAITANSIRMPIHNFSSDIQFIDTNYMLITIEDDGESVVISPWRDSKITDLGGSTYDSKRKSFTLNYSFENKNGNIITVEEKITDMNFTDSDLE